MRLHAKPVVDPRRPRRAVLWTVAALLAVTAIAGCQTLNAWSMLMLGNGGSADSSDYPDPCARASPSLPPQFTHGEASVKMTGGTVKTLTLTLEEGLFMPAGAAQADDCLGGTEMTYRDAAGGWMLDISLPDNGAASPSATRVDVFFLQPESTSAAGIESSDCQAVMTSVDAAMVSGTVTCAGVSWTDMGSGANPSPSGPPVDMTITFTAKP